MHLCLPHTGNFHICLGKVNTRACVRHTFLCARLRLNRACTTCWLEVGFKFSKGTWTWPQDGEKSVCHTLAWGWVQVPEGYLNLTSRRRREERWPYVLVCVVMVRQSVRHLPTWGWVQVPEGHLNLTSRWREEHASHAGLRSGSSAWRLLKPDLKTSSWGACSICSCICGQG